MTWKSKLRQSSFRGVPFYVLSASDAGGRRRAEHEYINRDQPYSEDLGGQKRTFTLRGYVIGEDYINQRNRLETALSQPGPGILVHPWRGSLNVTVNYTTEHSPENGGLCVFVLTCTDAGNNVYPRLNFNSANNLKAAANNITQQASDYFNQQFNSQFTNVTASQTTTTMVNQMMQQFDLPLQTDPYYLPDNNSLVEQIKTGLNNKYAALTTPVYNKVQGLLNDSISLGIDTLTSAIPANGVIGAAATQPIYITVAQRLIDHNKTVLQRFLTMLTTAKISELIADADYNMDFLTTQQLEHIINQVVTKIESLYYQADDPLYLQLKTLKINLLADYRQRSLNIVNHKKITPHKTISAISLIYAQTGSLDTHQLIHLNHIVHPGFIKANQPIEFINDN